MVYNGTPSKGCAPCRARKTKCDQSTPSCGQCLRAGRTCTGYRNEQTLVFRDETKKVVGKIHAAKRRKNVMFSTKMVRADSCDSQNPSTRDTAITRQPATVDNRIFRRNFPVPLEDQATCFFFRNFILPEVGFSRPPSSCMPAIFKQASANSALPAIIASIGMAGISKLLKSPEIMVIARQRHMSVLRLINSSLQDPESAKTDQTLVAVFLLGLFETVTGSSQESMDSWAKHILGAATLIHIRGRDQLQSDIGRRLFRLLRLQIVIHCISMLRPIPEKIMRWSETTQEDEGVDWVVENRLFRVLARLCALRKAVLFTTTVQYTTDEVRSLAYSIDADFAKWANRLPLEYAYMTRTIANSEDIFSDHYHVYKGFWIAGIWNVYRCGRILTHELIMKTLSNQPGSMAAHFTAMYGDSVAVANQISSDICASVPYYFSAEFDCDDSSHIPIAIAGHALLWPLFVVGTFPESSPSTQAWVTQQLQKVGNFTGIGQATSLAHILRTKMQVMPWEMKLSSSAQEADGFWARLICPGRPTTFQALAVSETESMTDELAYHGR